MKGVTQLPEDREEGLRILGAHKIQVEKDLKERLGWINEFAPAWERYKLDANRICEKQLDDF